MLFLWSRWDNTTFVFLCPLAHVIWRIVHIAFNITPPTNIINLFGNWLNGVGKRGKTQIRVGVCALLWAIWHVWNDYVFNKAKNTSFMQVIPLATHWIRTWSYLQSQDRRQDMDFGCNRLETVMQEFFTQFGWQCANRIACWCIGVSCYAVSFVGWFMFWHFVILEL